MSKIEQLAKILGTPQNLKLLLDVIYPQLTPDNMWDNEKNKLNSSTKDADAIKDYMKMPAEYLGSHFLAREIMKQQIISMVNEVGKHLGGDKDEIIKKDNKNKYV